MGLSSCGMMSEDNDDCSVYVRVTYDMNMKFADAFDSEVRKVTLYAFDGDGSLVYRKTESRDNMPGGVMALDGIEPGVYDILVWAEGEERNAASFTFGSVADGGTRDGLTCRLERETSSPGFGLIDNDLTPLFHGMAGGCRLTLSAEREPSATVNLTKNTNVVRVTLQDYDGLSDIDADKYTFRITDDNGYMAHDNSMLADDSLTYRPWSTYAGSAGVTVDGSEASISVAIAELTTGRLMADKKPRLTITGDDGREVLSVPLIDYFLLVKGNYNRAMDDQEYLDRQDEYNITFFLKGGKWMSASIIINSWRVVMSEVDM